MRNFLDHLSPRQSLLTRSGKGSFEAVKSPSKYANFLPFLLVGLLLGCTNNLEISPVNLVEDKTIHPVQGNYTAFVEQGAWVLEAKSRSAVFAVGGYESNLNEIYADALKATLKANLQSVVFSEVPIPASQIRSLGFDRQIIIHQGKAESSFRIHKTFPLTGQQGDASLNVTIAIIDAENTIKQEIAAGHGYLIKSSIFDLREEVIKSATESALKNLLENIVTTLRKQITTN